MNHPTDRDETQVRHAWPQASAELPPAKLDAAILAAAREATRGPAEPAPLAARRRSWHGLSGWQPFAAAAAIAGVAFVLLQSQPRHDPAVPTGTSEQRTAAPAAAAASPEVAATAGSAERTTTGQPERMDAGQRPSMPEPVARQDRAPAQDAALPAPAPPSVAAKSSEAADLDAAGGGSPQARPGESARAAAPLRPAEWVARIGTQLDSGDEVGAVQTLRAFRTAVADADSHLPASLQEWARTVQ